MYEISDFFKNTFTPKDWTGEMNKKALKNARRDADLQASARECEKDGDGRVIINMNVKDDSNFLSVFSSSATPVISGEVADFIEGCTHASPPGEQFTLRIYSDCIDGEEQEIYRSAIKEYYTGRYIASKKELKRNKVIVLLLALFGVLTLSLAFMIDNIIWSEVIDIAAWVFLWEAVDVSFFRNRSIKYDELRCLSHMTMKVEYYDSEIMKG